MKKMTLHTVVVTRENEMTKKVEEVHVKPNTLFDFTDAEIKQLEGLSHPAIRDPQNEDENEEVSDLGPLPNKTDDLTGGSVNKDIAQAGAGMAGMPKTARETMQPVAPVAPATKLPTTDDL